MNHDETFLPAFAMFSVMAVASFAAGWFSQGLFGAF